MIGKGFLVFLSFTLLTFRSYAQWQEIKHTLRKLYENNDTVRLGSILMVPDLGASPEKGFEFGGALVHHFYFNPKDKASNVSNYLLRADYSLKKVFRIGGRWDVWLKKNQSHSIGEGYYMHQPLYYFGVGPRTLDKNKDLVDVYSVRVETTHERRIIGNYFGGMTMYYDNTSFRNKHNDGYFWNDGYAYGKNGGQALFIGITQTYDSRNAVTYSSEGGMVRLACSYAPPIFSNNAFEGGLASLDARWFKEVLPKVVWATQFLGKSIIGGTEVPFYLMPTLGGDKVFRGYYAGRFQDLNMAKVETEIRYRPHDRVGIMGLVGVGSVFHSMSSEIILKPNFGFGVRYFFDLEKKLSARVDCIFGEKLPGESRQKGIYFSVGEAF